MHLQDQYPKAVKKLDEYLQKTTEEVHIYREKKPIDIIYDFMSSLRTSFESSTPSLLDTVRQILDTMNVEIKRFELKPSKEQSSFRLLDKFDDEPFEGQRFKDNAGIGYELVSVIGAGTSSEQFKLNNSETKADKQLPRSQIFTTNSSIDDQVAEIKTLLGTRCLRNVVHADRQPVIEYYAKKFAMHYKCQIETAMNKIIIEIKRVIEAAYVLSKPLCFPAAKCHELKITALLDDCVSRAQEAVDIIHAHNAEPLLIFDTNGHYLNDMIGKMVAADTAMATDDGGARHIYHNVRAFIKSQVKHITEMASKVQCT